MNLIATEFRECPTTLPEDLCRLVAEFGRLWAESPQRPRISYDVLDCWDTLLDIWAKEPDLPLYIRKSSSIRGSEIEHKSGRKIVFCDNSPAHWSYVLASRGESPSLADIKFSVNSDSIPVVMIQKVADKPHATYHRSLSSEFNVNKHGWKLAHIHQVGLKTRTRLSEIPIDTIIQKFKFLLSPSNMFVVPLKWAGIAEAQEVVDAIAATDKKVS